MSFEHYHKKIVAKSSVLVVVPWFWIVSKVQYELSYEGVYESINDRFVNW